MVLREHSINRWMETMKPKLAAKSLIVNDMLKLSGVCPNQRLIRYVWLVCCIREDEVVQKHIMSPACTSIVGILLSLSRHHNQYTNTPISLLYFNHLQH
jgi:hypothetical protein